MIAICEKHPCLHVGVTFVLSQRPSSAEPPCFLFPVRILLPDQESHITLYCTYKKGKLWQMEGKGAGEILLNSHVGRLGRDMSQESSEAVE